MSFDEFKKETEKSNNKITELKKYLNVNRTEQRIEFDKIKTEVLEANKQLFIEWWTDKVGELTAANKYMIKFRVDGNQKTVPLKQKLITNYWRNYKKAHLCIVWMRCQHGSMKQAKQ